MGAFLKLIVVAMVAGETTETMLKKRAGQKSRTSRLSRAAVKTSVFEKARLASKNARIARGTKTPHFARIETYYKQLADKQAERKDAKRNAESKGQIYVDAEPKLILVVRTKGIRKIPHRARKTMQLLNLTVINSARFLAANKATLNMLHAAEPYLTWGYPSLKCVQDLVYKRGYANVNGQRVAIASNELIARHLQQKNVICVEDLIHELFTVGDAFKECNRFMAPFRLNTARKGIVSKRRHFTNGGDYGLRGEFISSLVNRML